MGEIVGSLDRLVVKQWLNLKTENLKQNVKQWNGKSLPEKILEMGSAFFAYEIGSGWPINTGYLKPLHLGVPFTLALHNTIHMLTGHLFHFQIKPAEMDPQNLGVIGDLLSNIPKYYALASKLYVTTGNFMQTHMVGPPEYAPYVIIAPIIIQSLIGCALIKNRKKIKYKIIQNFMTAHGIYNFVQPILDITTRLNYESSDIYKFSLQLFPNINLSRGEVLTAGIALTMGIYGLYKLGEKIQYKASETIQNKLISTQAH